MTDKAEFTDRAAVALGNLGFGKDKAFGFKTVTASGIMLACSFERAADLPPRLGLYAKRRNCGGAALCLLRFSDEEAVALEPAPNVSVRTYTIDLANEAVVCDTGEIGGIGEALQACFGEAPVPRPAFAYTPVATYLLMAFNAAVFALGAAAPFDALSAGALSREALAYGEWWRLLTSMSLHVGLTHLAYNCGSLYIFGAALNTEAAFGHVRFLIIYLVSGICGGLLFAALAGDAYMAVAGASGAVFGVSGAAAAFTWINGKRRPFMTVALMTAVSLAAGFLIPGVANSGHVGGLLAGAALGLAFGRKRE